MYTCLNGGGKVLFLLNNSSSLSFQISIKMFFKDIMEERNESCSKIGERLYGVFSTRSSRRYVAIIKIFI